MGDAAILVVVKQVVGRLTTLAIQEFALLQGLKDDIQALKDDFDRIEATLQDAEERHNKEKAVELWLKSLRSASLKVENVVDEISTQALLQRLHKERGIIYRVRAFFSSNHNQFVFRVRIAHTVKAIRKMLDAIASKRFELKLIPSGSTSNISVGIEGEMPDRETSSHIHSSIIFGRNEEIEMVTRKICNKDIGRYDNDKIRVYGIWGMGGVGKTTLAQLVYNHERVNQCFELKCWTYVSEKFHVKEIIKGIIASIDKCECTLTHLDVLQESLQNKLKGKNFLIVLDDVWIEDGEKNKWDQLSETLSCGTEGSIVVMTTRSQTTSQMIAKLPELQHKLGCLSEEDSWLLFKKLAFEEGRAQADISELEPIGKEIVEKCKGLPLAVKTLGSLMWSKLCLSDWQRVKRSNIWELQENNVLPALKLSYDNLLPHMKRCFAYCSLFPKGYDMTKDVVFQLWVSNGFIPPKGETDLYMLAEDIFNCLVWRSFFDVNKDFKHSFKMHDLMHDMARLMMRHDFLVIESDKEVIVPNEVLHVSSSCPEFLFSPQDLGKLTSLRSILMFGKEYKCSITQIINHKYLRVLYLSGIELRTLPESISKLKHLKYLNLSYSSIEVLPESIIYLQNLQALLLFHCPWLRKLPEGLRYMRNLEHLDISDCYSLLHLPLGIKNLTSLRVLPLFPVGNQSGAKLGELRNLNRLEGMLEITGLENVGRLSEANSANLKFKRNLLVLELWWSGIDIRESKPEVFAYDEEVLEGLEPNPSLKTLKVFYNMGNIISPSWMVNLRNLAKFVLYGCKNCERIPPLGRLPNLRVIYLQDMDSLKCFHDDDTNMSEETTDKFFCLQELCIKRCPNLASMPHNLPKVKVLELRGCGKLVSLPDKIQSFKDLSKVEITDCIHLYKRYEKEAGVDWPKISHIPNIDIRRSELSDYGDDDDDEEGNKDEIDEINEFPFSIFSDYVDDDNHDDEDVDDKLR